MRRIVFALLIVAAIVAAAAIYLVATTPRTSDGVRFPLPERQLDLLASVPAGCDWFALVPEAAAVRDRLRENPITRAAMAGWAAEASLPRGWMLGGADLVAWRADDRTGYAFRVDAFRAFLVGTYLRFAGADVHAVGNVLFIGTPPVDRLGRAALAPYLELASVLPPGNALVLQRAATEMFPPIERPAATMIVVGPEELDIVSRARAAEPASVSPRPVMLPRGALLSAWFGEAPRILRDIDRLVPGTISTLLADGGSAVLYDIESRLLPRPEGIFVIPATAETREGARRLSGAAALVGEVADRGDRILIAIDRTSLALYERDELTPLPFPATDWALRIDSDRMLPVLERLGDNVGLRFAAPRLYRSVRELRSWIGHLESSDTIDAALTRGGEHEELRVRISAK